MSAMPQMPRGTILLCRFPFQTSPKLPGPLFHFCLFVDAFEHGDVNVAAMAYGTSRLDDALLEQHRGLILSVPAQHIKGAQMPGPVTHFVVDHVAVLPMVDAWVQPRFIARLDCFKQAHDADPLRRRLRQQFEQLEPVLRASALDATRDMIKTRRFGLPEGKLLRSG
jgi:hypothetical protein